MQLNRRRFLQVAASALPAIHLPHAFAARHQPLGLQIYTVREGNLLAKENLPATLKRIRAIGYEQIELGDTVTEIPPGELRRIIADAGLTAPGCHFSVEAFPSSFEYAKKLGLEWMILSTFSREQESSVEAFKRGAAQLNAWGKHARELGMRVGFHTHSHEYHEFNGVSGFDVLVANTDPELVSFEMDCFWAVDAGHDPVQIINRFGKRIRLLHMKDRKPGQNKQPFTEVGRGTLDWKAIVAAARKDGIEYYFVEQDETDNPPLETARISYNYLRKIMA